MQSNCSIIWFSMKHVQKERSCLLKLVKNLDVSQKRKIRNIDIPYRKAYPMKFKCKAKLEEVFFFLLQCCFAAYGCLKYYHKTYCFFFIETLIPCTPLSIMFLCLKTCLCMGLWPNYWQGFLNYLYLTENLNF